MAADFTGIWEEILRELEKDLSISAVSLDVFVRKLKPIAFKDGNIILMCETVANKSVIQKNYLNKMRDALVKIYPTLNIAVIDQSEKDTVLNTDFTPAVAVQDMSEPVQSNLISKYTFENFVVGKNSQLVHAAARAVTEQPGGTYNPLFIYGGVGLGKTHIMHAVGNLIVANRPELKVVYVTSERFTNEFIDSIRMARDKGNAAQAFRNRYRSANILMIDDIQFIANKTQTQEEFFHTFNDLKDRGNQIIITSDRHPREINPLEERLRSRFGGGLVADIQPPDLETRIAILQKKAANHGYIIKNDVLEYIAEQNDSNIRVLEENLTRVYFFSSLNDEPLTVEVAAKALKDNTRDDNEAVSIDLIIDVICGYYKVSRDDLLGKKKNKEIVYPRQMCIYLITESMTMPLASIGTIFGRDHTTIMHARDKISEELKTSPSIKLAIQDIRNKIYKR